MKSIKPITDDEVRQRAHQIWEEAGRPEGQETEHWLRAEKELREQRNRVPSDATATDQNAKPARNRPARGSTPATKPGLAMAATGA